MSSIKGTFSGTLLADGFGRTQGNDGPTYVYGDFAGLGWSVRWSAPEGLIPAAIRDTLDGGNNVEVTITGTIVAEVARSGAVMKLKATAVEVGSPATGNGQASREPVSAKS